MLPSLVPGAAPLYSSKDIIQNATVDLHALSRTLHKVQADRSVISKGLARNNALQSKLSEKNECIEGIEKDILRNVDTVSKSIKGSLSSDFLASILELEDHIKFDTKRMHRVMQQLQSQMKELDQEIAELMQSDQHFGKFRSNEQLKYQKMCSLESQLSFANKKLSTIQSAVKHLKVNLLDLAQSNQILRHRLHAKGAAQVELRTKICSLFADINRIENEEAQLQCTLTNLVTSSEKLETLCQQEWSHVMEIVAEKTVIEERLRHFRSGDQPKRRGAKKKDLAKVVSEVVQASEIDRICKIWAHCTWSNAIDSIKIESAKAWLKKRKQEWELISEEIGLDGGIDALCEWFAVHEEQNIQQFEEVRELALQRKVISAEAMTFENRDPVRNSWNTKTSLTVATALSHSIEEQTRELDMLEEERQLISSLLDETKQRLCEVLNIDDSTTETAANLSELMVVIEYWAKEALVEFYGNHLHLPDIKSGDEAIYPQIEPPDIRRTSGSLSDDENPV